MEEQITSELEKVKMELENFKKEKVELIKVLLGRGKEIANITNTNAHYEEQIFAAQEQMSKMKDQIDSLMKENEGLKKQVEMLNDKQFPGPSAQ